MKITSLEARNVLFEKENKVYRTIVNRPPQIKEVVENVIIRKVVNPTTTAPRKYINFRSPLTSPSEKKVTEHVYHWK